MYAIFFLKVLLASGHITVCLDTESIKLLKTGAKCLLLGNDQNLLRLLVFLLLWLDLNEII